MSDRCITTAPMQCIKLGYVNALSLFFCILPELYRRVVCARFRPPCLVISQLYDRHYFLGGWKKRQPLNNTSPPAGCTRIGYQPQGAAALFTTSAGVARISHHKKAKRTATVRENITTVIDHQTVIRRKRKYTARNKLWKVGIVMQSYVPW